MMGMISLMSQMMGSTDGSRTIRISRSECRMVGNYRPVHQPPCLTQTAPTALPHHPQLQDPQPSRLCLIKAAKRRRRGTSFRRRPPRPHFRLHPPINLLRQRKPPPTMPSLHRCTFNSKMGLTAQNLTCRPVNFPTWLHDSVVLSRSVHLQELLRWVRG